MIGENRVNVRWCKGTDEGIAGFRSLVQAIAWIGLYEVDFAFAYDTVSGTVYEYERRLD